jgi:hypothetical protein
MRFLAVALAVLIAQGKDENRDKPAGRAAKCGSEIAWRTTAEEAAAEAKKSNRLILWYVPSVAGSPMDRKNVVDNYWMMGPWMMRDVVELVSRKFVALRMSAKGDLAKQCGVVKLDFIEPGIVFLTPELKPVHRVDRTTTLQEEWFVELLRGVLKRAEAFDKPSAFVTAARKAGEKDALAVELMKDGDYPEALKSAESPLVKGQILRRMRKGEEAAEAIKAAKEAAKDDAARSEAACEEGILLLRQGKAAEAVAAFEAVKGRRADEATYLRGAALFLLNRDTDGLEAWKGLTDDKSPWAWKAEAETQRLGPFSRCFEELSWLPEYPKDPPSSSTVARKAKDLDLVTKRSVALLLRTQRKSGSWDDSNYDFGGKDSLPNVYMAGTALACSALLMWRDVDPKGVQAALERAWPYLLDEKNTAPADTDELIWAHAYRLDTLARLAADKERKAECVKKMNELVGLVTKEQGKSGIWHHEYDAPFTTATVLHCLWSAKQAGAEVPDELFKKGSEALSSCRNKQGVFSYGFPGRGFNPDQAGGRNPLCELALMLCGRSGEANVRGAIEVSFEKHALLERIRKYDDHADAAANGGFFFWYDMVGRAEAIRRVKDAAKLLEKQRDIALSITENDGCFVDSHELGKSYGTAMGLITLKLCDASSLKK